MGCCLRVSNVREEKLRVRFSSDPASVAVMAIFFYTSGVLATRLFGDTYPQWFGTLGGSL
jgi:hypothetical protein